MFRTVELTYYIHTFWGDDNTISTNSKISKRRDYSIPIMQATPPGEDKKLIRLLAIGLR